jgi:uncharacterized protein YutE (UPF0331/DUF86 family)
MVDEDRIVRLLRGVTDRIDRLSAAAQTPPEQRIDLWLDGVKYLFVTTIEGCVDVAHHISSSEGWSSPDTNATAMRALASHGVIGHHTGETLAAAAGFRNVLVHQYLAVDDTIVVAALDRLDDLRAFVADVARFLQR